MSKNNELKKLKRSDLLELMLELQKEVEHLKEENESLKKKIDDRTIIINESGNIAEAALMITDIFDEAQKAAEIYLESIREKNEVSQKDED